MGELEGHILIHTRLVDEDDDDDDDGDGKYADDYVGDLPKSVHKIVPCFKNIWFRSI